MKIENIKDYTVSIEEFLSRIASPDTISEETCPIDKNLISDNPGYFTDSRPMLGFDGEVVEGGDMSWLCVDMDEYLTAHKEVIEQPEKIREFAKYLTPLRRYSISEIPISHDYVPFEPAGFEPGSIRSDRYPIYKSQKGLEHAFREHIAGVSDSALIRNIFGFGSNHGAYIQFEYVSNKKEMLAYMKNEILKDYTIQKPHTDDGWLCATIANTKDDIELGVATQYHRGAENVSIEEEFLPSINDSIGFIDFLNVGDDTQFPKNDGKDIDRADRVRQLVDSLRSCEQVQRIYIKTGNDSVMPAWQGNSSATYGGKIKWKTK